MNLKHLKEMDDLRETCEEMSRMLYHRSSNGNYVNGNFQRRYNDNNDAQNRFRNNGPPFRNGQQNRPNRYYNKPSNINENGNDNTTREHENNNFGLFLKFKTFLLINFLDNNKETDENSEKKIKDKNFVKYESARRDNREDGRKNQKNRRPNNKVNFIYIFF